MPPRVVDGNQVRHVHCVVHLGEKRVGDSTTRCRTPGESRTFSRAFSNPHTETTAQAKKSTAVLGEGHGQATGQALQPQAVHIRGTRHTTQIGTGFKAWWESQPPITKWLATGMLAMTLAVNLQLIPVTWVALIWGPVLKRFEVSGHWYTISQVAVIVLCTPGELGLQHGRNHQSWPLAHRFGGWPPIFSCLAG
jgi:hypothetical protein